MNAGSLIPAGLSTCLGATSITQTDWGQWTESSCYKGFDFNVKKRGKNYDGTKIIWSVQFRIRYYEKMHFRNEIYYYQPSSPKTTYHTSLDYNETTDGFRKFYMNNDAPIWVYVDHVRFKVDDTSPYYLCDK